MITNHMFQLLPPFMVSLNIWNHETISASSIQNANIQFSNKKSNKLLQILAPDKSKKDIWHKEITRNPKISAINEVKISFN